MATNDPTVNPGLDGVVAAQTRLSSVDGLAGELIIAGFLVEELASKATFEEVVFLLWNDRLPNAQELADFNAALVAQRPLPQVALVLLYAAAAHKVDVMDALRMATSSISLRAPNSKAEQDLRPDALTLVARMPTMVAAYWRMLHGQEPLPPRPDLGHAANFLYMLFGEEPDPERTRGLETYLNAVVDHGMNASTFTARVIISTQSDIISAVAGAIGALKGPLHGGAPGPALDMVFEIGEPSRAESYLRAKLERDERLMGFGRSEERRVGKECRSRWSPYH